MLDMIIVASGRMMNCAIIWNWIVLRKVQIKGEQSRDGCGQEVRSGMTKAELSCDSSDETHS